MKLTLILVAISAIFLMTSGCASMLKTQSTTCITAKVFGAENEKLGKNFESGQELIKQFLERTKNIKIGSMTYEDFDSLGLNPDAVNVNHYPGQTAAANKRRFGSENMQLQFKNVKESDEFARGQSKWLVLEYPLYNIKEISDRFYFSKKNKEKYGTDLEFVVIFYDTSSSPHSSSLMDSRGRKNYLAQYVYLAGEKYLEKKETETAVGGGIIDILDKTKEQMQLILFFYFLQDAFKK